MSKFLTSLRNNSRKVLVKVNRKCYEIAWQLFTSVVRLTPSPSQPGPFAKGLLANQWYPSEGVPSSELGTDTDARGGSSLSRITAMTKGTAFLGKDGKLYLTNNVPYAYRAEVLGWPKSDGWSGRIGPYRMVARSLQAIVAKHKKVKL